ncbi:MAG: LptA/OstA family protein [Kiritimatiellia bacterium]|nr:LptA/OstA family protein [Kiritimatiellia bacterium]
MKKWTALLGLFWAAAGMAAEPAAPEPESAGTPESPPMEAMAPARDEEKTVITADRLEYDGVNLIVRFENNVVVEHPNLQLKADRVTAHFQTNQTVRLILAEGKVEIQREDFRAWAGRAAYNAETGEIVLEDSPRVARGRDTLTGEKITFWRDENRMVCEPQARMDIHPGKELNENRLRGGF